MGHVGLFWYGRFVVRVVVRGVQSELYSVCPTACETAENIAHKVECDRYVQSLNRDRGLNHRPRSCGQQ